MIWHDRAINTYKINKITLLRSIKRKNFKEIIVILITIKHLITICRLGSLKCLSTPREGTLLYQTQLCMFLDQNPSAKLRPPMGW